MSELPSSAKIVIVGGGIVGCSVAYHLGKMGLTDTLLLERGKLTCGSTWHAAGLVGQLRTSANITQLLGYSVALYDKLEQETGLATGWKRNGGLRLACNEERWTEVKRQATTATSFGLEMHLLTPKEAQDLWPLMQIDDVVGAAFLPTDGQASPSDITMSLAKGARMAGVNIAEGAKVTGIEVENGRVRAVVTDQGAHRLRQARDLRRPMVARDRAHGRRQHSARRGAAPISHHRADRRRDVEPADAARSGPSHLLEGGGRRPGHGRLRAQSQAVGHRGPTGEVRVPASRQRSRPFRAAARARRRPRAGHADGRHQGNSSTARRASPPTGISSSAKRRRCAASLSAPASTPSASPREAAPAWCWPNGSPRASRLTICGRSIFAASARTISTPIGCARAHSRPMPSTTPWPGRTRNIARGVRSAARRSTTGSRLKARASARSSAGNGRTGSPISRAGRSLRTSTPTSGRTGSMPWAASIEPAASGSPSSTRHRSPSSSWSAGMRRRRSPGLPPTMWQSRPAISSIRRC